VTCTAGSDSVLPCHGLLPLLPHSSLSIILPHVADVRGLNLPNIGRFATVRRIALGGYATQLWTPWKDHCLHWRRPWRRRRWRRRLRWPVDGNQLLNTAIFAWWRCTMCQYMQEHCNDSSYDVACVLADVLSRCVSKECCNGKQRLANNDGTPSQFAQSRRCPYCPGPNPVTPSWPTDGPYIPRFKCGLGSVM
jgi:hypothetical protein